VLQHSMVYLQHGGGKQCRPNDVTFISCIAKLHFRLGVRSCKCGDCVLA